MSKIHTLIEKNDIKGVHLLLDNDPSVVNEYVSEQVHDQPLHIAAWQNAVGIASLLIEKNVNLNTRGDGGRTPLHYAAQHGSIEVTKLLIDSGADLNSKDNWGYTPLLCAVRGREPSCIKIAHLLHKSGAHTDLNSLISLGDYRAVCELINREDSAIKEAIDPSALLEDAVIMIISQVQDKELSSSQSSEVVVSTYEQMVTALLKAGVDINAIGSSGTPALFTAIQSNIVPLVQLLLQHGADVNFQLHDNGRIIHAMAFTSGDQGQPVRQLLKEFGFRKP